MDISGFSNCLVSITQFNKGQASPLFTRAQNGETLLVVKNNSPIAVILSPEEYDILRTLPKICNKVLESSQEEFPSEIVCLLNKLKQLDESSD